MAATVKIWSDGVPPQVNAADMNGFKFENNNLIGSTGEALDPNDHDQTSQAVSAYAAGGAFYSDSGSVNAYGLSTVGSKFPPKAYFTGMSANFVPQTTNTGASTINITTLGVRNLLLPDGNPLTAGAVRGGEYVSTFYDGVDFKIVGRFEVISGGFPGEMKHGYFNPIPIGWLEYAEGSIGNAGSVANLLASVEAEPLFTNIWDLASDMFAPVSGGRGASAAIDFAANKTITLPEGPARTIGVAGSQTGLTTRSIGEFVGQEEHTLTVAELAPHTHDVERYDILEPHDIPVTGNQHWANTQTVSSSSTGGGDPHNNIQPSLYLRTIIKL